jgi:cytochrome oxidase Cu insertion factor (SCO1/SenC/PrrC family)
MVGDMAGTSQPALFHSLVSWFASLDAGHAFAVNLAFVLALAAMGVLLLQPRLGLVRCGVILSAVVCLVDWILIEDLGFFGGVGTDPNSMIPTFLVVGAGYLALTRQPAHPEEPAAVPVPTPTFRQALAADPAYAFRSVAALSAMVVTLMGVVPMLIVTPNRHADPILTEAADGPVNAVDLPAGDFSLTDQNGRPVTLASLRGKVVALTFLDPVCTNDCPVVAAEFRAADRMLGADAGRVAMVAINANPVFRNAAYVQAFDAQEDLTNVSNWQFLTGGLPALSTAWKEYGILVSVEPGGGMIDHSFVSYIIDSTGQTRFELDSSPGSDTSAFTSSFAQTLAGSIERVLHS